MIFEINDELELRPMCLNDIPMIEKLCTPAVMKYMNKEIVCPLKLAQRIESSLIPHEFSIFENNSLIGGLVFKHADEVHILDIGYWLSEDFQQKGIMSICLPAFIDKVITDWYINSLGHVGIRRIQAVVLAENTASLKLLLKSGFANQVLMKDSFYKNGKFHNQILVGMRVKKSSFDGILKIKVTESVFLRRLKSEDSHSLQQSICHPEVLEFTRMPMDYTLEMAQSWIASNDTPATTNSAIVHSSGNNERVIGMIGIVPKAGASKYTIEIGYWLTTEFSGAGLMTQTVKVFISSFVSELYMSSWGKFVKRIHASVRKDNIGSQRVLEKNGFKIEGIVEAGIMKNGRVYDEIIYAKVLS